MSLATFLRVNGYTSLGIVIIGIIFYACSRLEAARNLCCLKMVNIISRLYGLFRIIWMISASVLFWGFLKGGEKCDRYINGYMWSMILIFYASLIGGIILLYREWNKEEEEELNE